MSRSKYVMCFVIFLILCFIGVNIVLGSVAQAILEIHPQAGPPGTTLTLITSESSFPSGATVTFFAVLGAPILVTMTAPTILNSTTLAVEVPPLQLTFAGQRVNYGVRVNNPDGTVFDELGGGGNFSPTGPGILLARVDGQSENSNSGSSLNLNPGESVKIIANFYTEPDAASSGCGLLLDFPVTFYSTNPSAVSVELLTPTVPTAYPPVPPATNTATATLTQDSIDNLNSLGINDFGAVAKVTALSSSPADIVVEVPVAPVGLGDGSCPLGSSVGTGGAAVVIFPINGGQGTTSGKGGAGGAGGGGGAAGAAGCATSTVTGPPNITPTIDVSTLSQSLFGTISGTLASGDTITGISFSGANGSAGTYTQGPLGIGDGIVLSTGCVGDIPGSNDTSSQSGAFSSPGNSLLDTLSGGTTFDAASFTVNFDAGPSTTSISFDIVFGTEEYPEFVGSLFNDAFGIFLNGTQIAFDQANRPITINGGLFSGNIAVTDTGTELDGSTPRLTITAPVTPGSTGNTLVFAIADTSDPVWDSAVFIASGGSSTSDLTIGVETNQGSYQTGDTLILNVDVNNPTSSAIEVDALVSVTIPDGSRFFLASDKSFSATVTPFVSKVEIPVGFTLPSTTIFSLQLPPGLPEGIYNWQVQLVRPGTEIPISNIASTLINISP